MLVPSENKEKLEEAKPVIYVWINKEFKMSAGKVAAQAAHAVAQMLAPKASEDGNAFWINFSHRTIIIYQARDTHHMYNIAEYLSKRGIDTEMVIDEGANEVPAHSATAMCTGIMDKDKCETLMSTMELYTDEEELEVPLWPMTPDFSVFLANRGGILL